MRNAIGRFLLKAGSKVMGDDAPVLNVINVTMPPLDVAKFVEGMRRAKRGEAGR